MAAREELQPQSLHVRLVSYPGAQSGVYLPSGDPSLPRKPGIRTQARHGSAEQHNATVGNHKAVNRRR